MSVLYAKRDVVARFVIWNWGIVCDCVYLFVWCLFVVDNFIVERNWVVYLWVSDFLWVVDFELVISVFELFFGRFVDILFE